MIDINYLNLAGYYEYKGSGVFGGGRGIAPLSPCCRTLLCESTYTEWAAQDARAGTWCIAC